MGDVIFLCVLAWVVIGVAAAAAVGDGPNAWLAFFWPVSVPILFVFGLVWAVCRSVKVGFSFFKEYV